MTITIRLIFLVLALICFLLATFAVAPGPKGGWTPLGLVFLTLSFWPGLE